MRVARPSLSRERQRGFALVTVLWVGLILAAVVASLSATGRTEGRLARTHYDIARLDAAAAGAINVAILRMLGPASQAPPVDATPFAVEIGGQAVGVTVQDEAGKIDLNMANGDLLKRLLIAAGAGPEDARPLTEKILQWRDGGAARSPAPFKSVGELQLVPGMTPELFERIAPCLTVYSQSPWVDPAAAPPDVLEALAAMGGPAPATVLAARSAGSTDAAKIGHAFMITAEADGADGLRVAKTAVVRLTGSPLAPIAVYEWR